MRTRRHARSSASYPTTVLGSSFTPRVFLREEVVISFPPIRPPSSQHRGIGGWMRRATLNLHHHRACRLRPPRRRRRLRDRNSQSRRRWREWRDRDRLLPDQPLVHQLCAPLDTHESRYTHESCTRRTRRARARARAACAPTSLLSSSMNGNAPASCEASSSMNASSYDACTCVLGCVPVPHLPRRFTHLNTSLALDMYGVRLCTVLLAIRDIPG